MRTRRLARVAITTAFAALAPAAAGAQRPEVVEHQRSAAPADARFEVVQSALAARSTYRIDKHLGTVSQLVMAEDSTLSWEEIPRAAHPAGDPRVPGRVNYQLFVSGLANRFTFLVNVNTGATWRLVLNRRGILVWQPLR